MKRTFTTSTIVSATIASISFIIGCIFSTSLGEKQYLLLSLIPLVVVFFLVVHCLRASKRTTWQRVFLGRIFKHVPDDDELNSTWIMHNAHLFATNWGYSIDIKSISRIKLNHIVKILAIPAVWAVALSPVNAQTSCDCNEYIYLAESANSSILKFRVDSIFPLIEVAGANGLHWYPGTTTSALPGPHGFTMDLNGSVYIGSSTMNPNEIRKLDCDGNLEPTSDFVISNPPDQLNSLISIGNLLYGNNIGGVSEYSTCDQAKTRDLCLLDLNGNQLSTDPDSLKYRTWGLDINEVTNIITFTVWGPSTNDPLTDARAFQAIYSLTREQFEAAMQPGAPCVAPFIPRDPVKTLLDLVPGDRVLPSNLRGIRGVTTDDEGNFYVSVITGTAISGVLLKYNSSGEYVAQSGVFSSVVRSIGVAWSREYDILFVSNFIDDPAVDCISAYNTDLDYLGTAVPNPGVLDTDINSSKAIRILRECCPSPSIEPEIDINLCDVELGEKFFLNEIVFQDCDGIVCGVEWDATTLIGFTFDDCDKSITYIGGEGCSTINMTTSEVTGTSCAATSSRIEICVGRTPPLFPLDPVVCETAAGDGIQLDVVDLIQNPNNATLTFSIAGNPITLPYTFPVGTSTVDVDAISAAGECTNDTVLVVEVISFPEIQTMNGTVCSGSSIDLATLVTNTGGGTLSYHTTLAAARTGTPALASSTVSPASATNYYVRSVNSGGCSMILEITITIRSTNCGTIIISGPYKRE